MRRLAGGLVEDHVGGAELAERGVSLVHVGPARCLDHDGACLLPAAWLAGGGGPKNCIALPTRAKKSCCPQNREGALAMRSFPEIRFKKGGLVGPLGLEPRTPGLK